jgi:hypothetical protein
MGAETISIPVSGAGLWQVRLSFAEPEAVEAGERVMTVRIQNKTVLTDFDVTKVSGGARRILTREFEVEAKDGKITIELKSTGGLPTLISGVELVRK